MSLKQIRIIILYSAVLLLIFGTGYRFGKGDFNFKLNTSSLPISINRTIPANRSNVDFSLFWEVWDKLESAYLRKENLIPQKMVDGAISGMVAALGDPYTVYLPQQEQKQSKDDLAGSFEGVGIQLGFKDSRMAIIAPLKDTPAEKVGLKSGDFILKIKDDAKKIDKETTGMNLPEAVILIKGPRGTEVILTILRGSEQTPFDVKLLRETILVKSVDLSFDNKIAVLRLSRFGERTDEEWNAAVSEIVLRSEKGEVRSLILDLRNNPGGFLQGAVYVVSEFLTDGVVVKQQNAGDINNQSFNVNRKGRLTKIPLVVLINPGSASASEIVAGALKEKGRAKLVGEKSFGKGTIQEAEELNGGAGLHITIARWLMPSGKSIDKEGITPDFEVKMNEKDPPSGEAGQTKDPQLEKAKGLL